MSLLEDYEDGTLENKIEKWFVAKKTRPVFGLLGNLSSGIDFDLINYVATKNPNSLIALVGPVSSKTKKIINKLPSNVFCPGPVPAIGVKYCLRNFDVGMVPFLYTHFNSRRNPIKITQYIATGIPVVSTIVGEDIADSRFVYQCGTAQEFSEKLLIAYENNSEAIREERIYWGERNSWRRRIEFLDQIIERFKLHQIQQ